MSDEDLWRAVWLCAHSESDAGPPFPLGPVPGRHGSYRIHVCRACNAFCIRNHLGGRLSDWHPPNFLPAAQRGDRSLLEQPW